MGIIIDLVIVACMLLCILTGFRKGLSGNLFKLLSFVIAIIITLLLYKPITNEIINKTTIDDNIKATIINAFNHKEEANNAREQINSTLQIKMIDDITKNVQNAAETAKDKVVAETADTITTSLISLATGIILFILIRIILLVVGLFIHGIASLPILKEVDKVGGIVYGAAQGLVIIYAVLGVISFISVANPNNNINAMINKSTLGSMMYNNNVIVNFLFK